MVEVRKREHETTAAMLRRFTRRVQQSGILIHARRTKFYASKPSRRNVRERAMRRIEILKERKRLEKLGKNTEEIKR